MKTKAAILYELNKPLIIDEVEIPPLKRGQVLVKILFSGICGAQYNEIIGLKGPDRFLPHLLGHEASAIVDKIGPGVTKVKKGDYIALSWIKGKGLDGLNTQYQKNGRVINAGAVTTFSEYSVVSENRVTKISKQMPPDVAAIIGCAIVTGSGIVHNTLQVKPKTSIAIFGVGGIGSSVLLAARKAGCQIIIAVDLSSTKLEAAKELGATHTISADDPELVQRIKEILPSGADYSVDASGARRAMETAFEILNTKGICVIAGNLSKDEKISLHPFELIKGKRIVGTWGGETNPDKDIPKYVRQYLDGGLPIKKMITHRFKLDQINAAFETLKKKEAGRIVLDMTP